MSSSDSAKQSKAQRRLTVIIVLWGVGIWLNLFNAQTPGNWVMTVLWIIFQLIWCAALITNAFAQLSGKAEWLPPGQVLARVLGYMSLLEGIFAQVYVLLSVNRPEAFSSPLTGIDAAYFTISTATTTGMGDIHPVSGAARLLVTAQMVSSLALVVAALGVALNRFYGQATPPRKSEGASGELDD